MTKKAIHVTTYSGYRDDEVPRSIVLNGEEINVLEILDMWIEEDIKERVRKRVFRMKCSDGYVHTICYNEGANQWFSY